MKYETPQLLALTSAMNAIQTIGHNKFWRTNVIDIPTLTVNDGQLGYADWE